MGKQAKTTNKKMYYAEFSTSNGTHTVRPYEDTNKTRLVKDIREIAEGNTPIGSSCQWYVYDSNNNIIAQGGRRNGKRWRD